MLKTWWKIIKTATLAIGILLTFLVFIEILRAYQTLYSLHPVAGYTFICVLAASAVWMLIYFGRAIVSTPPALEPPLLGDIKTAPDGRMLTFARYLEKYMLRLSNNPSLNHEMRKQVRTETQNYLEALNTGRNGPYLRVTITQAQEKAIEPALEALDQQAEKEIRACVATVMAGVTLSPYKAADLMIVIYRNIAMTARIMRIYNSRPRTGQFLRTVSDIIAVVATVNYINMGKNLIEGLASRAPLIGKYSDDIAQGIGAGFMTSVVGHAAMHRSRAFKRWDRAQAADSLKSKAADFYEDVRDMFKKDILPSIMHRIGDASKETFDKIGTAIDETGNLVGTFIKAPIEAAVTAGTTSTRAVYKTSAKGLSIAGKLATKLTARFKKKIGA